MTLWYHRLKKLEGYHFGVLCCAVITAVVFIINLVLTIWAVSTSGVQNGLGTLQDGSCKKITTLTFWAHLAINVLSTLLLGASNYSMQCLSSPTRREVDKAHGKGIWLDIGVPSVRNLRHLSIARVTLWWLLAISSIPLHLLYNSAVFSTSCSNQYNSFLVSSDFVNGAPFSFPDFELSDITFEVLDGYQKNQTSLKRLDVNTCVDVYTAPIISSHSDVLLVSTYSSLDCQHNQKLLVNNKTSDVTNLTTFCKQYSHPNITNSLLLFQYGQQGSILDDNLAIKTPGSNDDDLSDFDLFDLNPLTCSNAIECEMSFANLSDPQNWLRYCLSVPVEDHCKLQFSLAIMIVVIVCNLIKTVCMSTIAWKRDPEPLVTLGDAITSFMDRPDGRTEGNCIAEKARFEKSKSWDSLSRSWHSKNLVLFRAASSRRWIVCNIL